MFPVGRLLRTMSEGGYPLPKDADKAGELEEDDGEIFASDGVSEPDPALLKSLECACCLTPVLAGMIMACKNGHIICRPCLRSYMETRCRALNNPQVQFIGVDHMRINCPTCKVLSFYKEQVALQRLADDTLKKKCFHCKEMHSALEINRSHNAMCLSRKVYCKTSDGLHVCFEGPNGFEEKKSAEIARGTWVYFRGSRGEEVYYKTAFPDGMQRIYAQGPNGPYITKDIHIIDGRERVVPYTGTMPGFERPCIKPSRKRARDEEEGGSSSAASAAGAPAGFAAPSSGAGASAGSAVAGLGSVLVPGPILPLRDLRDKLKGELDQLVASVKNKEDGYQLEANQSLQRYLCNGMFSASIYAYETPFGVRSTKVQVSYVAANAELVKKRFAREPKYFKINSTGVPLDRFFRILEGPP